MAWTPPTVADFRLRYPQFVAYSDGMIQVVLDDSNIRIGRGNWLDIDRTPASLSLTAHRLALTVAPDAGDGSGNGGGTPGAGGQTGAIKSRTRKVGDVSDTTEYETKSDFFNISGGGSGGGSAGVLGDFFLTPYGREYLYLMKVNFPAVAVVYR